MIAGTDIKFVHGNVGVRRRIDLGVDGHVERRCAKALVSRRDLRALTRKKSGRDVCLRHYTSARGRNHFTDVS